MLREGFAEVLSKSGIESAGLGGFSAEGVLGAGRSLAIFVLKWEEGVQMGTGNMSLKAEARICYSDDEPDPGEPGKIEKNVAFDQWFSKPSIGAPLPIMDVKRAWSQDILSHLPDAVRGKRGDWGGADIVCPCCGHPGLLTDQGSRLLTCIRCGNDSITGQPEEVLQRATKVQERIGMSVGLIGLGVLPILGFWIYLLFSHNFIFWLFAVCHVLGALGIFFGVLFLRPALVQHRQVKAEQSKFGQQLRFPEAAALNEQRIQAAGK
jgi:hypothetical protein